MGQSRRTNSNQLVQSGEQLAGILKGTFDPLTYLQNSENLAEMILTYQGTSPLNFKSIKVRTKEMWAGTSKPVQPNCYSQVASWPAFCGAT